MEDLFINSEKYIQGMQRLSIASEKELYPDLAADLIGWEQNAAPDDYQKQTRQCQTWKIHWIAF